MKKIYLLSFIALIGCDEIDKLRGVDLKACNERTLYLAFFAENPSELAKDPQRLDALIRETKEGSLKVDELLGKGANELLWGFLVMLSGEDGKGSKPWETPIIQAQVSKTTLISKTHNTPVCKVHHPDESSYLCYMWNPATLQYSVSINCKAS